MAKALQMTAYFAAIALFLGVASAGASQDLTPVIDQIELVGVTLFQEEQIQAALEVGPGDRLDRTKVLRTAEAIQGLYRRHGYEQAAVRTRLLRKKDEDGAAVGVLEFAVAEGLPTRIGEVRFVPDSLRDEAYKHYWDSIVASLDAKLALRAGDILDQEKLMAGRRVIQDLLASEEFVGAKVVEVNALPREAPPGLKHDAVARWVTLEVHVDLGDRVSFGFRGNKVFTSLQLESLIEELRVIGFRKDYIQSIRDQIAKKYRGVGYSQVRVTAFSYERPSRQEKHITYVIEEGPKTVIEQIDFDGNLAFTTRELRSQFEEKASDLVRAGYYSDEDVERATQLLIEWIKSRGYLFSKLVTINTEFSPRDEVHPAGARVKLTIYLYEGHQTVVQSVSVIGATALSNAEIKRLLGNAEGDPINLYAFSEGLEALKTSYRAKGFQEMKIMNEGSDQLVRYSDENRFADIAIEVVEGMQYRLSRVMIEGLGSTKENVVRREIALKEGDVLEEPRVIETEARLRKLGIFSVVTIRYLDEPERAGYKALKISLQEGTPGVLAGGVGFRNDLGVRVFGEAAYTNLWGRNHTLGLNMTLNRRIEDFRFGEYQGQLSYLYPWFVLPEVTFRPSLTVSRNQFISFDAENVSAAGTWERKLWSNPNITGSLTGAYERIKQFNAVKVPEVDDATLLIATITPGIRFDTRDQPLNPSRGLFSSMSMEFALPQLSKSTFPSDDVEYPIGYTKFQLRTDYFVPLFKRGVWFFSFRTGFERNFVISPDDPLTGLPNPKVGTIPLIKQFTLGGAGSLRGLKEQEMNFQNVAVHGTLSYVNYRTQMDLPFAGDLRFGPFLDAANLNIDHYSFGALFFGAGVGFHYPTPVGPVNLDWGFNLNRPDTDPYRFYFSIGII